MVSLESSGKIILSTHNKYQHPSWAAASQFFTIMRCRHCRNSARRNQRCLPSPRHLQRQTLSFGVLLSQLSISIAIVIILQSSILCVSFAPPLSVVTESLAISRVTFSAPCKIQCPRNSCVEMNAKKRRKKSPTYTRGEDEGVSKIDDAPENDVVQKPKRTTLSGGPSLIFEMARRMLVWDDELYDSGMLNDAGSRSGEGTKESLPQSQPKQLAAFPPLISTIISPSPLRSTEVATSPLPRWRPSAIRQQSISNVNPAFRTSSPIMTNAGFAGILRRNSRKRNKPSMWRHCLRIYNKMGELENGIIRDSVGGGDSVTTKNMGRGGTENYYLNYLSSSGGSQKTKKVKRGVAHHEAALVAASKLGMWEEAILIFQNVESSSSNRTVTASTGSNDRTRGWEDDYVTDNMILSVISACVKGSKVKHAAGSSAPCDNSGIDGAGRTNDTNSRGFNTTRRTISPSQPILRTLTVDERRKPLDIARDILLSMEEKHGNPLVSRHINPLASAYNRLGLCREASALINEHLKDRTPPPPPPPLLKNQYTSPSTKSRLWRGNRELLSDNPGFEGVPLVEWNDESLMNEDGVDASLNDDYDLIERTQLNIHEMKSKDRASYSLLVQSAAMEGDWTNAVLELQRMTAAGFHPNSRERNCWNEVMERGCRPAGNGVKNAVEMRRTEQRRQRWKKKRDGIWLGNLS